MNPLPDLISRLQAATGPDRELDIAIYTNVINEFAQPFKEQNWGGGWVWSTFDRGIRVPRYTASIDTVLTLMPEGCEWECGSATLVANGRWHWAKIITSDAEFIGKGPITPAIALLIAIFKAIAAKTPGEAEPP